MSYPLGRLVGMDLTALSLGLVFGVVLGLGLAGLIVWLLKRPHTEPAWTGEDTAQALDQLHDHLIALDRDRAQAHGELRAQVLQMG
ncbi:MAG: hypothetical protein M3381_03055, partial [Actinomycetota bacterium]|nr:hypothetical protein [Actinomycetota bacterium]